MQFSCADPEPFDADPDPIINYDPDPNAILNLDPRTKQALELSKERKYF